MSTQHQRTTLTNLLASGQAATQRELVEGYLRRAGIATTKMVADFLGTPKLSTVTGRLDELASQGKVIKCLTPAGKTGWKYIHDREQWPALAFRYRLEKLKRNIYRVIRSDEDGVLAGNLVNRLKLAGNDVDRLIAQI